MIQITKFMNPDESIWSSGMKLTIIEWVEKQRKMIEEKTGKKTYIKTKNGKIAIYRERLK
jgi:hypothetical protein